MKIIGIEEHIGMDDIPQIQRRLNDMDEIGIDMQVLSMGGRPRIDFLDEKEGAAMARSINEALSNIVEKYPERFSAFAAIAIRDPDAAAKELERAVFTSFFRNLLATLRTTSVPWILVSMVRTGSSTIS